MVETIFQIKRSPGSAAPTSLLFGEPAWVEATNTLYIGRSDNTVVGIPFGASYQPSSARLNELSALSPTNGTFLVGNGSGFVLQAGAGARSLLGLGSAAIAASTDFVGAAEKGAAGGVATLDGTGKVPASQLSSPYIPVLSVFGRTGAITAQPGDYTAAQVGALAIANNLSDIPNATTARTNLGLGSAATASTASLLDRNNHTGTQPVSTIAGLQIALDSKLSGFELDDHLSAPILDHPDGSVTDIKIGNRTITDTLVPTGLGPGSLTQWLEWIVNRVKAITGKANWWETPATTLQATASHLASTSNPHNVTVAQIGAIAATEKGAAGGVATLDGAGKIPTAQIPPIAIKDTFPVNSEAEMLALTAEVGDVAIRLDSEQSFVLRLPGASTLSNWQEMLTKTAVTSVFGRSGVVGAQAGDYTTDQVTEGGNLYFSVERSRNSLSATGPLAYNATTGTFSVPNTTATWNANQLQGRAISTTAPTTGQSLRWNGTTWEAATPTVTSANITDASTTGRSLVTAVDAAAARSAIGAIAGPSSTAGAIARFANTVGDLANSSVTISDAGDLGVGVTPSATKLAVATSSVNQKGLVVSSTWQVNGYPLLELRAGSNLLMAQLDAFGRFYLNPGQLSSVSPSVIDAAFAMSPRVTGAKAFVLRALSGQVANLISVENSSGGSLFTVAPDGSVAIASTTASTSTTTGAATIAGGLGVVGALNIGGNLAVTSGRIFFDATNTKSLESAGNNLTASGNHLIAGFGVWCRGGRLTGIDAASNSNGDLLLFSNGVERFRVNTSGDFRNLISPPSASSATTSATAGTLAAGTYYYRVVAVDSSGLVSLPSNEISVTLSGTNSAVINFQTVLGSSNYRIYRGNTSGGQSGYFLVSLSNANAGGINATATDSGQTLTTGTVPLTATGSIFNIKGNTGEFITPGCTINTAGQIDINPGTNLKARITNQSIGFSRSADGAYVSSITHNGANLLTYTSRTDHLFTGNGVVNLMGVGLYQNTIPKAWIGTTAPNQALAPTLFVLAGDPALPAFTARGAVSQTANLQEWQNNAGTVLASVSSVGNLAIASTTQSTSTTSGALTVAGGGAFGGNLNVAGSISAVGIAARATISVNTGAIAPQANAALSITTLGKTFLLLNATSSVPARIRLYRSEAYRLADLNRAVGTDPTGEHGLILDLVTVTGNLDWDLAPIVWGSVVSGNAIAATITNMSAVEQSISLSFSRILMEA